jgi:hypothetical protein
MYSRSDERFWQWANVVGLIVITFIHATGNATAARRHR